MTLVPACRLRRRLLLAGAACASVSPPAFAFTTGRHEVLAFYYTWYGDPRQHPDWRGVDTARHKIANAPDYPVDGPYDSHSPQEIWRQLTEMKNAGITGIIYSWWGIGSYEDKILPSVLRIATQLGLSVTLYYENIFLLNGTIQPESVVKDIGYIVNKYTGAQSWLKVGNRPVIFIYTRTLNQMPTDGWHTALEGIRASTGTHVFFNAAAADDIDLHLFDAIHRYAIVGDLLNGFKPNSSAPTGAEMLAWGTQFYGKLMERQQGFALTSLTVFPGYNDTLLGRPKPHLAPRDNGRLYTSLWQAAAAYKPDWILITSWNEWHEGTEIEPSLQYGSLFLDETRHYALPFLAS